MGALDGEGFEFEENPRCCDDDGRDVFPLDCIIPSEASSLVSKSAE